MSNPDILRSLFTADCTVIVEHTGVVSWCNEFAVDVLGIAPGATAGWELPRECGLFYPSRRTALQLQDLPLGRLLAGQSMDPVEICVRNPRTGGEDIWMRVAAEPIYAEECDYPDAALVIACDITNEKLVRQRLEDANAALLALVEASPLAIVTVDTAGNVGFWNRTAELMFGWAEYEVSGKPLPYFPASEPADFPRDEPPSSPTEVLLNREIVLHRKNGTPVDVSLSSAPVKDPQGAITGTLFMHADISGRKRLEERVSRAARLESLGMMAGGVAHDFNNLLTTIQGNASIALEDARAGSAQERALCGILESIDRAVTLTGQMLAFSGRGNLQPEPLDLSLLVAELLPLIRAAFGQRVVLNPDLPPGLPRVDGDAGQLKQIVMNLAINAGEAIHGEGEITLRTGLADPGSRADEAPFGVQRPGRHVFVEVRDTGHGMDASTLSRIFDPFFTTKFTGRGLGLAAVLGVTRAHKGTVLVKSRPGRGSSFSVCLPAPEHPAARYRFLLPGSPPAPPDASI